jgi:hypothetical protein
VLLEEPLLCLRSVFRFVKCLCLFLFLVLVFFGLEFERGILRYFEERYFDESRHFWTLFNAARDTFERSRADSVCFV